MLERLGEALAHERAFVADASHELRTPLAILRTELELALAKGRSPEELRAALASAAEETDRLTQLSEDLLTIAQTERGELPLRLARLDLVETLDGVERRFARRAQERGRQIEVVAAASAGRSPPIVCASTRRSAAWSTTPSATARARLNSSPVKGTARSRSTSATRAAVFRRTSSAAPSSASAALRPAIVTAAAVSGLAIVQTVARAHGGEAHAGNRAEGGADVWLTLPSTHT